ncbi:MAG: spondin domain-containing protein [Pseudomonadota bacterium]
MLRSRLAGLATLTLVVGVSASASHAATQLQVTVENLQPSGSFSFTPVYFGLHDGSFDAFTFNAAASDGIEILAELGDPSTVRDERIAAAPGSQGFVVAAPGDGFPPISPGESAVEVIDVADALNNRYLTLLSMVIPSNDLFFGNDNPFAYEIFDAAGNFLGPQSIEITAEQFYDAGTEINDALEGPAFVTNANTPPNGVGGADEGGVVTLAENLPSEFGSAVTPAGALDGSLLNFADDRASFALARITITEVAAPVPLPAGAVLGLSGLLAMGGLRAFRRSKTR